MTTPLTGGYYWFPTPHVGWLNWRLSREQLLVHSTMSESLEVEVAWLEENRGAFEKGDVAHIQRRRCRHPQPVSIHTLSGVRKTNTELSGDP